MHTQIQYAVRRPTERIRVGKREERERKRNRKGKWEREKSLRNER